MNGFGGVSVEKKCPTANIFLDEIGNVLKKVERGRGNWLRYEIGVFHAHNMHLNIRNITFFFRISVKNLLAKIRKLQKFKQDENHPRKIFK